MTTNYDNDIYYDVSSTRISDAVIKKLVNDGVVRACETGDGPTRYQLDEHGLGVVIGLIVTYDCHGRKHYNFTDPDGYACPIKPINDHQSDETFIDEDGHVHTTWSSLSYDNIAELIAKYITYDYASPVKKVMIDLADFIHDIMDSDYLFYYLPLVLVIITIITVTICCVLDPSSKTQSSNSCEILNSNTRSSECRFKLKDGRTVVCIDTIHGESCDWAHATTENK